MVITISTPKNTNLTIDNDLLAWVDGNIVAKRFASRSHAVNLALSMMKAELQGPRLFRSIITQSVGATSMELKTEPSEGDVQIQSVTIINFDSKSDKIIIGIYIPNDGNPKWHPFGEPWIDVKPNSPCFSDKIFYLKKGDIVYARFEGINLDDSKYSKLELNVNGIYLARTSLLIYQ